MLALTAGAHIVKASDRKWLNCGRTRIPLGAGQIKPLQHVELMDRAQTAAEMRQCVEADEGWQADPSALSVHEIANFHARAPECQNARKHRLR